MGKYVSIFSLILLSLLTASILTPGSIFASDQKEAGISAVLTRPEIKLQEDRRVVVLKKFLESYKSPLADSAQTLVKTADDNNLDWRLIAAISGVESTFAHQLPSNSYNAWGWGIYGDNMIYFKSYDDAISTIAKGLREKYMDKWGAQDVYQIGRFYAASPTWASRVDYFMQKIHQFELDNPENSLAMSL